MSWFRLPNQIKCNDVYYDLPKKGNLPVIGVCLDGTSPTHLTGSKMPHFWSGSYRDAHAFLPSVTNTNNVSIITGVDPSVHGVVANTVLKPKKKGGSDKHPKDAGPEGLVETPLIHESALNCETILSCASQKGNPVLVVTAKKKLVNLLGKGVHANSLIVAVEDLGDKNSPSLKALEDKGLEGALNEAGPPPHIYTPEASVYCLKLAYEILELGKYLGFTPSLVYISTTDYVQHLNSRTSKVSRDYYEAVDRELGRLKLQGRVGVTADHGMNLKTTFHFIEDIVSQKNLSCQVGIAIKDAHMIHHLGFGSYVTVHTPKQDRQAVWDILKELPGVTRCQKNEQGVLEVFGDKRTALGSTKSFHYQHKDHLARKIRTHGGEAEVLVPLAFLFEMDSKVNNQFLQTPQLYNKDLFFFLCK